MTLHSLPLEIALLGWSVLLLFVHIMVQGQSATRERGIDWNAGPRDATGEVKPLGLLAERAARALDNFRETYPAFVALALALAVSGRTGGIGALGAALWFASRIVYLPLYLAGIPYLRSIVWLASATGLLMMLARLSGLM